ncbi:MAG: hypothetical protein AVO34_01150 [Firmicutes bacterium ML8_F2]|nr:MAG: hypothetical protein AVO34_01150 [Firmicutes bacterium ML8_F2]
MGSGDPFGNEATQEVAFGMGGIRTAGDLVMRMQLSGGLKIEAAKKYVAEKLGVTTVELSDCSVIREIRKNLGLGYPMPDPGATKGIGAKIRIAELLGQKINSVEQFKKKTGLHY